MFVILINDKNYCGILCFENSVYHERTSIIVYPPGWLLRQENLSFGPAIVISPLVSITMKDVCGSDVNNSCNSCRGSNEPNSVVSNYFIMLSTYSVHEITSHRYVVHLYNIALYTRSTLEGKKNTYWFRFLSWNIMIVKGGRNIIF